MTGLPYVLVVLFALGDGSVLTMQTAQDFASPLNCSMRAFIENESPGLRSQGTYVCMTRGNAETFLNGRKPRPAVAAAPAPFVAQGEAKETAAPAARP